MSNPILPLNVLFTTRLLFDDILTKNTLKDCIGIYILISFDYIKNVISAIHIGESGCLATRIQDHDRTWDRALLFFCRNHKNHAESISEQPINTGTCLYLESQLIDRFKNRREFVVTPERRHRFTTIDPGQKAQLDNYLIEMLNIFDILNNKSFYTIREYGTHYMIKSYGVKSFCTHKDGKYILHCGSIIRPETGESFPDKLKETREHYMHRNIIGYRSGYLKVLEDIEFDSASYSASFVLGTKVNGNVHWHPIE